MTSMEHADKVFKEKYNNGKIGRHISLCDELFYDYKIFCFNELDMVPVSTRIQLIMVKDMIENSKKT